MTSQEPLRKDLTPQEFQMFRDWIHQHSGIYLEDIKIDSLRISLVTRATRFGFNDYRDYFHLLVADEQEFRELMNLVTINETSFFRFPAQFDAFRDRVIPEILQSKAQADRRFRVWSAGCSTGEEPYTIAMSLRESTLEPLGYSMEVLGSDVSTQALEKARRGVYPQRSLNNLSQNAISQWFEPFEEGFRPVSKVRSLCTFDFHNLIKEPYPLAYLSGWDVIFCRNVTIYFRLESTRRVVDNFFEALNPGGYLFIGHSETLTSVSDRFEPVEINGVFLYRKPLTKRGFTFNDVVAKRSEEPAKASERLRARRLKNEAAEQSKRRAAENARAEDATAANDKGAVPVEQSAAELVTRAHELLESANAREALGFALRALELEPHDLDAHVVAAFAYADTGDFAAARAQAEQALAVNPLAASARYILGVIKRDQGDLDGAVTDFKRAIYLDRDFVLAHFALASIHRQAGEMAQACREYENTLRALYANPEGAWTAFLGGFRSDLLMKTCEMGLLECGKGRSRG